MNQTSQPSVTSSDVPVPEQRILIVEDEAVFATAVEKHLSRAGYRVQVVGDLAAARKQLASLEPHLVLLDMRLPDGSGLDLLSDISAGEDMPTSVVAMSAYGEVEDAVSAMKRGATDYLKKPVDLEELVVIVRKVLDRGELQRRVLYSSKRAQHITDSVEFLGDSQGVQQIREQVRRICALSEAGATAPPTVLILGETGTGKDVVARMLHAGSARNHRPFVQVDCASLPGDLIEAELFGHEKGAFTSAHIDRTGLIEAAEDGVLFMDEIGEVPLALQAKLLAVLERRTVRRVGTTRERPVAAWFVAATNRDLAAQAEAGEFRADLYFRLNVLTISMPALRERGDDVLLLADHFAGQTARRYGFSAPAFLPDARAALQSYAWPGNVRELKHLVERAVLLSSGEKIGFETLGLNTAGTGPAAGQALDAAATTLDEAEKYLIAMALQRCRGNVSQAARELGVTRMALRYRIKKYGLP